MENYLKLENLRRAVEIKALLDAIDQRKIQLTHATITTCVKLVQVYGLKFETTLTQAIKDTKVNKTNLFRTFIALRKIGVAQRIKQDDVIRERVDFTKVIVLPMLIDTRNLCVMLADIRPYNVVDEFKRLVEMRREQKINPPTLQATVTALVAMKEIGLDYRNFPASVIGLIVDLFQFDFDWAFKIFIEIWKEIQLKMFRTVQYALVPDKVDNDLKLELDTSKIAEKIKLTSSLIWEDIMNWIFENGKSKLSEAFGVEFSNIQDAMIFFSQIKSHTISYLRSAVDELAADERVFSGVLQELFEL